MFGDRSLVAEFVVEAQEHLDAVEPLLLEIEKSGRFDARAANEIFREIHSVKGAAGLLGLDAVAALTHALESVLGRLRDGPLVWSAAFAEPLLRGVDHLRELLRALPEDAGRLDRALLARIEALGAGETPLDAACAAQRRRGHSLALVRLPEAARERAERLARLARFAEIVRDDLDGGERALVGSALEPDLLAEALGMDPGDVAAWNGQVEPKPVQPENGAEPVPRAARAADSIRVRVEALDRLMDLSGELSLVRDRLRAGAGSGSREAMLELDRIAAELQHSVTLARLQPIRALFERMPRLVRDVARRLGKQASLELIGGDVEIDRSLLEALADPLTHLVRNALDHGIEAPSARAASGKPPAGRLALRASALRGRVRIELEDDGAGIDLALVRTAAVQRGVVSIADVAALDDRDVIDLIFDAGVSTAPGVSELSGRGVGLDVVRTNLERLGARIEVRSEPGRGTRFRIELPLALALVPALVVTARGEALVIPQASVSRAARGSDAIERIAGREVMRASGQRLPIVRLARVLDRDAADGPTGQLLVVRCGAGRYALAVDRIDDAGPVVAKPLPSRLAECGWYSSCALLADGRPALILDPAGIARAAGLRPDELPEAVDPAPGANARPAFVVFEACAGRRFAIALPELRRVEAIAARRIDRIAGRDYFEREGRAVPLLHLDALLGLEPRAAQTPDLALFPRHEGAPLAIAAERIVATLPLESELAPISQAPGIAGSTQVEQRMTLVLEPRALLARAEQGL